MKTGCVLAAHTTLKIGGKAAGWYEPKDRAELSFFLKSISRDIPVFPVGCGSNLLVKDGPVKKLFVRLGRPDFCRLDVQGKRVEAGGGLKLSVLVRLLTELGFTGHEFLAGIPGTLGGAVAMNAGARTDSRDAGTYREMKDILESLTVVNRRGEILRIPRKAARLTYRGSCLGAYIVLGATLKLKKGKRDIIRSRIRQILDNRRRFQDLSFPSAGSFFKNPGEGKTAGQLIDACGLKGLGVGGAFVSVKHANFIVNKGGASCRDVIKLMEIIRKTVYNRYKIMLDPEVKIVN
ncbi:MAG: UDP-N-acetylmuramate dehydrogenase [Candidatus Omnitrophota bacterium]